MTIWRMPEADVFPLGMKLAVGPSRVRLGIRCGIRCGIRWCESAVGPEAATAGTMGRRSDPLMGSIHF